MPQQRSPAPAIAGVEPHAIPSSGVEIGCYTVAATEFYHWTSREGYGIQGGQYIRLNSGGLDPDSIAVHSSSSLLHTFLNPTVTQS